MALQMFLTPGLSSSETSLVVILVRALEGTEEWFFLPGMGDIPSFSPQNTFLLLQFLPFYIPVDFFTSVWIHLSPILQSSNFFQLKTL